jgi:hypothetical protein
MKHLRIFLLGMAFIAFLTIVIGFVIGPVALATRTGNNNWFYLYAPLGLGFIYFMGLSLEK